MKKYKNDQKEAEVCKCKNNFTMPLNADIQRMPKS